MSRRPVSRIVHQMPTPPRNKGVTEKSKDLAMAHQMWHLINMVRVMLPMFQAA
jgi:hypothetical protein